MVRRIMAPKMRQKQREAIAYHEAGHAVAHCLFRVPFRKATITPAEDYLGIVVGYKLGRKLIQGFEIGFPTLRQRDRLERQVLCLLAGPICEAHFRGRRNNIGASDDYRMATGFLDHLSGGSPNQIDPYAKWLAAWATDMVLSPVWWPFVETIAQELLRRESLSAKEILELYKRALSKVPERFQSTVATEL
jgi:ATP-dependent Zn protease